MRHEFGKKYNLNTLGRILGTKSCLFTSEKNSYDTSSCMNTFICVFFFLIYFEIDSYRP